MTDQTSETTPDGLDVAAVKRDPEALLLEVWSLLTSAPWSGTKSKRARRLKNQVLGLLHSGGLRPWRPEDGDTRCQSCGMSYEPWTTNSRLWNRVIGSPNGYLCPRCFAARAAKHVKVWHLEAEPSKTEVELRRALFHERENFARAEAAEARAAAADRVIDRVRALADQWETFGAFDVVYETAGELAQVLRAALDPAVPATEGEA